MTAFSLILLISSLPFAAGFGWDDFTNNLATDLAPLITLFGEQVTKQFLSESLDILDNIIFAMAPLGILTAVVSAIRVCGSPTLRAFIGRAQEGPGNAELELLSCTSATTSELWNEGGIARVFGRPQILEVVKADKASDSEFEGNDDGEEVDSKFTAGTYLFAEAVEKKSLWQQHARPHDALRRQEEAPKEDRPNPNLSLNIGITRPGDKTRLCAAVTGATLQIGVLVYASITMYLFPGRFSIDGRGAEKYAFPMTFIGTILVCLGLFLCAFLIERSTDEVRYEKAQESTIYWVQPGNQKVGDQVFGSFIGQSHGDQYIVSKKAGKTEGNKRPFDFPETRGLAKISVWWGFPTIQLKVGESNVDIPWILWLALISTSLGFVIQFIGLRAMHPSVILAQLLSTLVMAIWRAGLRAKRNPKNLLNGDSNLPLNLIPGHELDWLAMHFNGIESREMRVYICDRPSKEWMHQPTNTHRGDLSTDEHISHANETREETANDHRLTSVTRALRARLRLAHLTNKDDHIEWAELPVRLTAQKLCRAIEEIMELVAGDLQTEVFRWPIIVEHVGDKDTSDIRGKQYFISMRRRRNTLWELNHTQLEAVIGMWAWSYLKTTQKDGSNIRLIASNQHEKVIYHEWIQRRSVLDEQGIHETGNIPRFGLRTPERNPISRITTNHPARIMCAQDIFISFLSAVSAEVENCVHGVAILQDHPIRRNQFIWENDQVERMVNCFEDSGLGSREDGYMCTIRALTPWLHSLKLEIRPKIRQQALFWAAKIGHVALMEKLLKGTISDSRGGEENQDAGRDTQDPRANINGQDEYGATALIWAIYSGDIETVKWLLKEGADVHVKFSMPNEIIEEERARARARRRAIRARARRRAEDFRAFRDFRAIRDIEEAMIAEEFEAFTAVDLARFLDKVRGTQHSERSMTDVLARHGAN